MSQIPVILAAVLSFAITAVGGLFIIPFLKRLHYGQTIKEIGPTWHKGKQGTPTMGGLMFIIGIPVATLIAYFAMQGLDKNTFATILPSHRARLFYGLLMALAFGFLGFLDDYIKVVKKRNLGLRAREKMLGQLLIAAAYIAACYLSGDRSTSVKVPFAGDIELGLWYFPLALFVIVGTVNAVNLTDGLDGLSSSVTFCASLGFIVMSGMLGFAGMNILSAALAGGCIGFLLYNFDPSKVFMGDTGSLFLGGLVTALAFGIGLPVALVLLGIIYVIETVSDILQIGFFKLTHKRIFKMAPIHHHFEMCGWSEVKIVTVFSVITLIGAVLTIIWVSAL